jgi:hypothetical protein
MHPSQRPCVRSGQVQQHAKARDGEEANPSIPTIVGAKNPLISSASLGALLVAYSLGTWGLAFLIGSRLSDPSSIHPPLQPVLNSFAVTLPSPSVSTMWKLVTKGAALSA